MTKQGRYQTIKDFLAAHNVLSLAMRDDDGAPHAVSLMYANDQLALYWISDPKSRHSRHIETDARIAATIARDYSDFESIRGLQIFGTAQRVDDATEANHALNLLVVKFRISDRFLDGSGDLSERLEGSAIYRLDCKSVTLIDNTVAFGHKENWNIAGEDSVQE